MLRMVMALGVALVLAMPAAAQDVEIRGVISEQIEAFEADDFERAFTFASPTIRQIFRTPDNFGRMVVQGYPMVWRPAELRYLDLRKEGGTYRQRVMITDAEGRRHLLEYRMLQTENGWKINGVQILKAPGVGA